MVRIPTSSTWVLLSALAGATCAGPGLPEPGTLPPGIGIQGTWESNWGRMELRQEGDRVEGTYDYCDGCSIRGTLRGDILVFEWIQPGDIHAARPSVHGHGYLRVSSDGRTMEGEWGYRDAYRGGGLWTASRPFEGPVKTPPPEEEP